LRTRSSGGARRDAAALCPAPGRSGCGTPDVSAPPHLPLVAGGPSKSAPGAAEADRQRASNSTNRPWSIIRRRHESWMRRGHAVVASRSSEPAPASRAGCRPLLFEPFTPGDASYTRQGSRARAWAWRSPSSSSKAHCIIGFESHAVQGRAILFTLRFSGSMTGAAAPVAGDGQHAPPSGPPFPAVYFPSVRPPLWPRLL